jgi:hypothetical protein
MFVRHMQIWFIVFQEMFVSDARVKEVLKDEERAKEPETYMFK